MACHKSAGTPGTSRCGGWPPPNTRLREPTHVKKPATPPVLPAALPRWGRSTPLVHQEQSRQSIRDCATKRCKSPPAGMPRNHDWNAASSKMATTKCINSALSFVGWVIGVDSHKHTQHRRRKPERTEHKNTFGEHLLFSRWLTQTFHRPPTHSPRARSRAVQGRRVSGCACLLFSRRGWLAQVSISEWAGRRANASDPPAQLSKRHPYSNCAPSHMR